MLRQIRRGVFETNSSSVHSLTIVSKEDYEKFKNGELLFDSWSDKLVSSPEEAKYAEDVVSYEDYGYEYEQFEQSYTTPSGDEIVAFGYYGHD